MYISPIMAKKKIPSFRNLTEKLFQLRTQFGKNEALEKISLLDQLNKLYPENKKGLLIYHDHLLFMMAYPDNQSVRKKVEEELQRISDYCKRQEKKSKSKFYDDFHATGIAHSAVTWLPSVDACKWMLDHFEKELELVRFENSLEKLEELLPALVTSAQWDSLQATDYSIETWLNKAAGGKSDTAKLRWIVNAFLHKEMPETVRDYLFDALEITVDWKITDYKASRSGNILPSKKIHYQTEPIIKKVNPVEFLAKPLVGFKELKGVAFEEISFSAKSVLAALSRETDTVSYADRIYKASVENGIDVYLFEMRNGRKMPIENYTGYVAYKNGIPVAYGGCWIFLERCEIGVNVFESVRGGETNLIMVNLMRVYHQLFNVKRFVVPPYQFGEDNPEGIQSGAFWFYYRLGYRPVDKKLRTKADQEYVKILKNPKYRSSYKTLESFTLSPMELMLEGYTGTIDLKKLSAGVNLMIAAQFGGDTAKAMNYYYKKITEELKTDSNKLFTTETEKWVKPILLFWHHYSFAALSKEDKKMVVRLLNLKFTHERDFSRMLLNLQQKLSFWK